MKPNQINDLNHTDENSRAEDEGPASTGEESPTPLTKTELTPELADTQIYWTIVWDTLWGVSRSALRLIKATDAKEASATAMRNFENEYAQQCAVDEFIRQRDMSGGKLRIAVAKADKSTAVEARRAEARSDDNSKIAKIYLVRATTLIRSWDEDECWEFNRFLVRATSASRAYFAAIQSHARVFFSGHIPVGEWVTNTNFAGEECLAFYPSFARSGFDIEVLLMIEELTELPPDDAMVVKKYLHYVECSS